MSGFRRPPSLHDFHIAVICALTIEFDAVDALFDEDWEKEKKYKIHPGDPNAYSMGRMGVFNIVLAKMPGMGKADSAAMAAHFHRSFPQIRLGLVVGICGGVPFIREVPRGPRDVEVHLGDIVISTGIVQYDFGHQYSNEFIPKDTLKDKLGRPNVEIRSFLGKMEARKNRMHLEARIPSHLADLFRQSGFEKSRHQGAHNDILYEPIYRHKHHGPTSCICAICHTRDDKVCDNALISTCDDLKCDPRQQVIRTRFKGFEKASSDQSNPSNMEDTAAPKPRVHFGLVASGDSVVKCAHHRDILASREDEEVIAFEMEGAGAWDSFPTVVIKGVVDYADSHKSFLWQGYGAACAAACMKAFVSEWRPKMETQESQAGSSILGPINTSSGDSTGTKQKWVEAQSTKEQIAMEVNHACLLLRRRNNDSMKEDLEAAKEVLSRLEPRSLELEAYLVQRIHWGLMIAEKELSCYGELDAVNKLKHIIEAQRHGAEVAKVVSRSDNASLRAQISLEQNIVKGRMAILNLATGREVDVSNSLKLGAIDGIDQALEELRAVDLASYNEVSMAAMAWSTRFRSHLQ